MKLFNFTRNTYGENWFIMAEDRQAAIDKARRFIKKEYDTAVGRANLDGLKAEHPDLDDFSAPCWERALKEKRELAAFHRDSDLRHLEACVDQTAHYPGGADACGIVEVPDGVAFTEVC